jgi:ABC-2 type transport system ATP-binding protein
VTGLLASASPALVLVPVLLVCLGLVAYALVDIARSRGATRALPWVVWVLLVVLSVPLGAVLYLLVGRPAGGPPAPVADPPTGTVPAPAAPSPPAPPPAAATTPPPRVVTRDLVRDYGGTGVLGVDLDVPAGSVYGLVGPNGAGKTTLLSLLIGTRHAGSGTVDLGVGPGRVAVGPDVPEFEPWLTAYEVVDLARALVAPDVGREAVDAALATAGLSESAHRRVGGYSRGMLQRVGLAAALVGDPALLVLDEPTSALDPAGRAEVLELVGAMRGRRTVVFSSHILGDVQRVADTVGIMRAGRLVYQGATQALVDDHLTPCWDVRVPEPDAEAVRDALRAQPWVREVETPTPGTIRVRAFALEEGQRGIPRVVAGCGARLVACDPVESDLESAFLALVDPEAAP